MGANRPGRNYRVRGILTKAKRRKNSPSGPKCKAGFRFIDPPAGGWFDPNTGKTFDRLGK